MKTIRELPLDAIPADSELARDLFDERGHLLFAAGTLLQRRHLDRLASFGYTTLPIGVHQMLAPDEWRAALRAIDARLDERFRNVRDDPVMEGLKRAVREYRLKELE